MVRVEFSVSVKKGYFATIHFSFENFFSNLVLSPLKNRIIFLSNCLFQWNKEVSIMKNYSKIGIFIFLSLILIITNQNSIFGQTSKDVSRSWQAPFVIPEGNVLTKIDIIWTVDYRPDTPKVQLFWIGPKSSVKVKTRIQKWEYKANNIEQGKFYTIVDSLQPESQNIYNFIDYDVNEGMYYRYKVWMELHGNYYISDVAFTVQRPEIEDWGDWQITPTVHNAVYINGVNDTVSVDSVEFTYPFHWCW